MVRPQDYLGEVGKIPRELLFKIADLVDENIITQSDIAGLKDILADTDTSVEKVMVVFYNIVLQKNDPKRFIKFIDSTSNLTDEEKNTLKDVVKYIHDKIDNSKIMINIRSKKLEIFGNMHVNTSKDDYFITTEFRPVSKKGKIVRIIPLLVMDIPISDSRGNNKSVNFQMNLEEAERFVDLLNKKIGSLRGEISDMHEKFGSEII